MSLLVTLKNNKFIKKLGNTVRCFACNDDVIYSVWSDGFVLVSKGAVLVRMSNNERYYGVNEYYVRTGWYFFSSRVYPGPVSPPVETFLKTRTTCFGKEHLYTIGTPEAPTRTLWVRATEPIII